MFIIEEIYNYYKEIGQEIESYFEKQVFLKYEKHYNRKLLSFTVLLEVIIPQKRAEADYGLVLSTNAQKASHNKLEISSNSKLFLISDISYGDGKIIKSSNEISFNFSDNTSTNEALGFVRSFFSDKIKLIKNELIQHMGW